MYFFLSRVGKLDPRLNVNGVASLHGVSISVNLHFILYSPSGHRPEQEFFLLHLPHPVIRPIISTT